jgi:sarcosine oxidase subunit beta
MADLEVCVVGGGAVGLATAMHLARRGVAVTVLEAETLAAGSSGLSVGVIESQYLDPAEIDLRVRALRFFDELERDGRLDIVRTGYLRLAADAAAVPRFEDSVAVHRSLGVDDVRVVGPDEIRRLAPDMRTDDVAAGLWGSRAGFVDGHTLCAAMADLARDAGARIETGARLTGASRDPAGRHVLETVRGTFGCDVVVNAAGPWGAGVARILGTEMPLSPQRHQAVVVHLARPLGYVMPMVMDYTPGSGDVGLYFRHERPGQLIAGLHTEDIVEEVADPGAYARTADPGFVETVAAKLADRLPALSDASLGHGWAGLYPISPDGRAQVGPVPGHPSVIVAGGTGGSGIQQSPTVGELAADWITYGEPRAIASGRAFAPDRRTLATATP